MAFWIALLAVAVLIVAALIMQSITGKSYITPMSDAELREMNKKHEEFNDSYNNPLNPASPYYTETEW